VPTFAYTNPVYACSDLLNIDVFTGAHHTLDHSYSADQVAMAYYLEMQSSDVCAG